MACPAQHGDSTGGQQDQQQDSDDGQSLAWWRGREFGGSLNCDGVMLGAFLNFFDFLIAPGLFAESMVLLGRDRWLLVAVQLFIIRSIAIRA